ncbi:MAG TPA: WYL domain-containing protein, partial [Acidimicrobiia bacterium]|nr:WYL domain-containing protein [Acidimicrobiia bacterium]
VCGLPGYGPGDLMVAEIDDDEVFVDTADYFASAPRLAPAEALALLASGIAVVGSGQASPALASAVEKLSRALLPEGTGVIDVDLAGEPDLVAILRDAAATNSVVEITYTSLSRDQTTVREVEPWSVFSSMGNWYLSGHCRMAGAERSFRVDRIRRAEATGAVFEPPKALPPRSIRYTPSVEDVRCRIALTPAARWVLDYYPVDIVSDGPEETVVEFSAGDPLVAARLLLRLGPQGRLLDGPEVIEALTTLRSRILSVYGD